MANLVLTPTWTPGVRRIEVGDPVKGGDDGVQNLQAVDVGNRTEWLKAQLEDVLPVVAGINEEDKGSLANNLAWLIGTKGAIKESIQNKGIGVPDDATFRSYADFIASISGDGGDVSNVQNLAWYNPGTGLGGISWTDPEVTFDHIEIIDTNGGGTAVVASIAPGVQYWEPATGTHSYLIRAVFSSGGHTQGVQLEQTNYSIVYAANLLAITIPMTAANEIILSFDNFIDLTSSAGFSISGITDTLTFVDQPDVKSIRLRLNTKVFASGVPYSLSYAASSGNVETNDGQPINDIIGQSIQNGSDYAPATFVSAEVPQAEPSTLVLVMSRPVSIGSFAAYSLTGTTATITGVVSSGATVQFNLSEPVDTSTVESNIRITYSGSGTTDDVGQTVPSFSNQAVTNNSTNQAISIQSAEIPSSNAKSLIVVMQGAVTMSGVAGFSLTSADQSELPNLAASSYTLSDGTITFTFDTTLLQNKLFTVSYNGSGSLKAASNGDTIRAFSQSVTNNSTDGGGISPGGSARNLGVVVLGHDPTSKAEVETVMDMIHNTVVSGNRANFYTGTSGGDYLTIPTFTVASGTYKDTNNADTSYTGGTFTSRTISGHGNQLTIEVVDTGGYKGKNSNTQDHIVMQFQNLPMGNTYNKMNNTNTNVGGYAACAMKKFIEDAFLTGMDNAGIKASYLLNVNRMVSTGQSTAALLSAKIFLLTEWEIFGANTYAATQENDGTQIHLARYTTGTTGAQAEKVKYNASDAGYYWWGASSRSSNATNFCNVGSTGAATLGNANSAYGVAPAFCVA